MSVVAIVNPASGRRRGAQIWENVQSHLRSAAETLKTTHPGHAVELTSRAIKQGATTIVAVGGDGTISEVVNGFFERDALISDSVVLGILPHGTGSDLQKMLHLPSNVEKAASLIQARKSRPIDLLKVRYTKSDGSHGFRYSINMTSFGMGGIVASRVSRSSKAFGGKTSFVLATLRAAMTFPGNTVMVTLDNDKTIDANVTNVAIGNGRYHGGGMLACPRAEIDDGFLDVTLIPFMKVSELVRNLRLLYNGDIYTHPQVQFFRVRNLRADSIEPALIEIDGESLGRLPVEISIVPRAIRILA